MKADSFLCLLAYTRDRTLTRSPPSLQSNSRIVRKQSICSIVLLLSHTSIYHLFVTLYALPTIAAGVIIPYSTSSALPQLASPDSIQNHIFDTVGK